MSILLKLFHISFYPSFFLVLCTANWAYASSSIEGKKLILDATGFGKSEPFIKTFYFLPNNSVTDDEWEHGAYTWIESGATGTVVLEDDGNEKFELVLNLSNNTFQGISTEGGQSTVAGSGTYSLSNYASGEIPYNQFFSDDFSSVTYSSSIWGSYSEYGLSAGLYNNAYGLSGTLNDSDERWSHEIGAKSLLSLASDWVVQGSAFSQSGETIEVSIECQEDKIGFQLEVHVGTTGSTVSSSIQYERFDKGSSWQSLYNSAYSGNNFGGNNSTFRIRNSAGEKSFHIEWLDGSAWRNLNSLNWETGTLSKNADYGSYQSSNQLNDWESMESYYFNPQMEFGVPESLTVNLGDYGFTSFSVTEGAPEPDPEYAPSSLVGKIYNGSMNDTYQFIDESNAIFYHQESNFQSSEVSGITYTWSPNGNSGTLTTSLDETTTLSFTSASEGTFQWQENGGSSSSGSFTLSEASAGYAPSILAGDSMIAGTTTYVFKENGIVTIRSNTGSQDSTYGFVKSENNEIVFSIPAHGNSVSSTLYKMTLSSTGAGTLSEGGSGSFQYFIDGSNQPSSKGWMWFDSYPWVYSSIEQDWIYFYPTSSTLMVYSSKDQVWREMVE
jgi:hypothetical protein